jgi:hypothetical protein
VKKAQYGAGSAATLVILIAGLIILYLLFLPPAERDALLGDQYVGLNGNYDSGSTLDLYDFNETALSTSPGRIDYLKEDEFEHLISAVNLYTVTQAGFLLQEDALYVKNGIFDQLFRDVEFTIGDLENTENVLLSFNIQKAAGRLQIYLNNEMIYDSYVETLMQPIDLSKRNLQAYNVLSFEVSEVGWQFWTTNEYELRNIQISADITDVSDQLAKNTFSVTDSEKFNMEGSSLRFFPDCQPVEVGALSIYMNNQMIYSSIPDCGVVNYIEFSPSILTAGDNNIIFKTARGTYLIYQIMVKTDMEPQVFPVYYFDLPEALFYFSEEYQHDIFYYEPACGDVDGTCPVGCDEDYDIDCCFAGRGNYWCDVMGEDEDDRCAAVINSAKCVDCPSGYEDDNGQAPEECEEMCGDDYDDVCPSGCDKYYDKDCCYAEDVNNFWCDVVPVYGIQDVCEQALSPEECDDCPTGYISDTSSYNDFCPSSGSDSFIEIVRIRPGYMIVLEMSFLDDGDRKSGHVYVNGHKFYFDTYGEYWEKDISNYVEDGSNAVKVEPDRTTLDIISLDVEVLS